MHWYFAVLKKYAIISGRARRKEFWLYMLVNWIVGIVLLGLFGVLFALAFPVLRSKAVGPGDILLLLTAYYFIFLGDLYYMATVVPSVAVGVRRLHDTDLSGWWLLIGLVPVIGPIILIVLMARDSTPGENRFGLNPKGMPLNLASAEEQESERTDV